MKHRFHLQKYKYGNKGTCPKCHRPKCFVYYIDEEKEIVFPKYVGRCDHESSCGYHYSPREYFRDNNIATPWEDTKPCWCQTEETHPKPVSFIDEEIVQSTLGHYSINPLFLYFCKVFGHEETQRLFNKYRVGTASIWNGATIYWQTDILGRTRGGKVMGYNPNDGHRIKNPQNRISWAHTLLRLQNFSMKQCFFGEHLLMDNVTNVAIVESEKTAMIASHFLPDFIWLATGGKHGCLNNDAIKVLSGKRVHLFPDLQAYDDWRAKEALFSAIGCHVSTSDFLERNATEDQREKGLDLGDFLLFEKTQHQLLHEIISSNPAIQDLINQMELEFADDKLH